MPREYEAIRDNIAAHGIRGKKISYDKAQEIAARTWNKRHPENTNPWAKEKKSAKQRYFSKKG